MSFEVMLVVLLAALLHAAWNAQIKSGDDKFADIVLLVIGSGVAAALVIPFVPVPDPASWYFLVASVAIHAVYFCLIALAYQTSDLSFAYPIMRGTAPLLTALLAALFIGENIGAGGWAGVLLLCGGILWLAHGVHHARRHTLFIPLLIAGGIVAYTLVDGLGARAAKNPVSYLVWMSFLTTFPVLALGLFWRRQIFSATPLRGWMKGFAGGIGSGGAYALILWAMTQAPIGMVAALRETSVLFGTALGALMLKERFGVERWIAATFIVAGAVVIKAI